MADGVSITAGTGTTIATDDTAAGHVQLVKLAISADGSSTAIPADATNGMAVDVTRVQGSVTVVGAAADGAALSGNPVLVAGTDGTNAQSLSVTAGGLLNVADGGATLSVDDGGASLTVDGTVSATSAGDVAHDTADSGNPVKTGSRAVSSLASATLVAAADRADRVGDLDGAIIVRQDRPLGDSLSERVTNTDGASTALSTFGATASARNVLEACSGYNDSTTGGFVDIRDGTAGTVLWTFPLPAKGGFNHTWPRGLRQPTANTALAFDVSAALTTVYLSFSGFKTKC